MYVAKAKDRYFDIYMFVYLLYMKIVAAKSRRKIPKRFNHFCSSTQFEKQTDRVDMCLFIYSAMLMKFVQIYFAFVKTQQEALEEHKTVAFQHFAFAAAPTQFCCS